MSNVRISSLAGLVCLAVLTGGCDSGTSCSSASSATSATCPPPSPSPSPVLQTCTQDVVESGSGSAAARTLYFDQFSVPDTGRLDITVDWTLASSPIGVYLVPANTCNTIEEFNAGSCNFLLRSSPSSTPKPKKLSIPNLAAGNYKWFIGNGGTQDESLSYQFVLSKGSGCPTFGSVPASAHASGDAVPFETMQKR